MGRIRVPAGGRYVAAAFMGGAVLAGCAGTPTLEPPSPSASIAAEAAARGEEPESAEPQWVRPTTFEGWLELYLGPEGPSMSEAQRMILEESRTSGVVTLDQVHRAVENGQECFAAAGIDGVIDYVSDDPRDWGMTVNLPPDPNGTESDRIIALSEDCKQSEVVAVGDVYRNQPAIVAMTTAPFEDYRAALVECLSSTTYAVDLEASRVEILDAALLDFGDRFAESCYETTGYAKAEQG